MFQQNVTWMERNVVFQKKKLNVPIDHLEEIASDHGAVKLPSLEERRLPRIVNGMVNQNVNQSKPTHANWYQPARDVTDKNVVFALFLEERKQDNKFADGEVQKFVLHNHQFVVAIGDI